MKRIFVSLIFITFIATSCKKSPDIPAAVTKPKTGTAWTYQLDTYGAGGTSFTSSTVTLNAAGEQTQGGEVFLNITDSTNATVYLLKQKTGGLYNYANGAVNLLCKEPGVLNEVYNGYYNGAATSFTVKETGILIGGSPFPDFTVNKYEATQAGILKDVIWFNTDAWIVRRETYAINMSGVNNIKYRWRLLKINY
jgi:hypothetical protein